ncbi:hypothetical protein ACIO3O_00200 [Streptomyces sp. NPDC087440]|uniref:hypothetical protein n=1 Tax=Streptomyces sp. NPDC087440 TaxID=3365790 RepID=UPI0037F97E4A
MKTQDHDLAECARTAAAELSRQGRHEDAWAVTAPYAQPHQWEAVNFAATLLESWGRTEAALALIRAQEGADRLAAPVEARLLVALGRGKKPSTCYAPV